MLDLDSSTSWHMSSFLREYSIPLILTLLLSGLSFFLHKEGGTSLVQEEEIWEGRVQLHAEYYPFSRRHFTTQSLLFLHDTFRVPYRSGFVTLQYSLCILLSLSFYAFLKELGFSRTRANVGIVLLLTSYPILCAHFQPVHTWDDLWQYIGSVLALLLAFRGKLLPAAIVLLIASIARETTLFTYPAFLLALLAQRRVRGSTRIVAALLPLVGTLVYLWLTFKPPDPVRFHNFGKNFLDSDWASHTMYSMLVSFGFIWITGFLGLLVVGRSLASQWRSTIIALGATYMVPLVVVTTLTLGLARETRLFFPLFIFLIPLTLWLWEHTATYLRTFYTRWFGIPAAAIFVVSTWGGISLARTLFPTFDFRAWPEFAQVYLGLHLGIAVSILIPLAMIPIQRLHSCTFSDMDSVDG